MVVGGVQDPGKVNNLNLLFYKTEHYKEDHTGANSQYELKIEHKLASVVNNKDLEMSINAA